MTTYIIYRKDQNNRIESVQSSGSASVEGIERRPQDYNLDPSLYGVWTVPPKFLRQIRPDTLHHTGTSAVVVTDSKGRPQGIQYLPLADLRRIHRRNRMAALKSRLLQNAGQLVLLDCFNELYPEISVDEERTVLKEQAQELYKEYQQASGDEVEVPDLLKELASKSFYSG